MLTIRKDQIDALQKAQVIAFHKRMLEHLKRGFPDRVRRITDDDLAAMIDNQTRHALDHGIHMEWDIRRFLELALLWGSAFERFPHSQEALQILADARLTGREKLNRIEHLDIY